MRPVRRLAVVAALACTVVHAGVFAHVRAVRGCAEIEPLPGRAPASACYVGSACVFGLRGTGLDDVDAAIVVARTGMAVPVQLLARGAPEKGSAEATSHCLPAASPDDDTFAVLRIPALEVAGRYAIELRRGARFGLAREPLRTSLEIQASHGWLTPRQPAASEQARQGEAKIFTFTGRQLAALRIRSGALAFQSALAGAGSDVGPPADVQWVAPDQTQVRIRLTLQRPGPVSTADLFEFVGSGESAVNRTLGWPVIQVAPRP